MEVKQIQVNLCIPARRGALALAAASAALLALTGCHIDMWNQPKDKPQSESEFFADGEGSRPLVAHTVDRDHLKIDQAYYTGYTGGQLVNGKLVGARYVDAIPQAAYKAFNSDPVTMLKRGQDRFNIFCSPCHSKLGDGNGMIAQRGFNLKRPPGNYHTERLRNMPIGHFYDVITNGYGTMTPRAFQVEQADRWAIAAYIRVLQRSQNARPGDTAGSGEQSTPPADNSSSPTAAPGAPNGAGAEVR